MKAPPIPSALAPEPTGLGDDGISIRWKGCPAKAPFPNHEKGKKRVAVKRRVKTTRTDNMATISGLLHGEFFNLFKRIIG
jgi:hypothetical protein